MKFCKDCAYFLKSENSTDANNLDKCTHPRVIRVSLVTGIGKPKYAELERWFLTGRCGYFAWHFTPRTQL